MGYKVGDEVIAKVRISEVYEKNNYPYEAVNVSHRNKARSIALRESDIIQKPDMTAEEAWEIAKNLFANYSNAELDDIFEKGWSFPKLMELTPQEAKAKIEAWEAEKEIKVGDEVEFDDTANDIHRSMYVTSKYNDTDYCGICRNGDTYCVHKLSLKKTGRHVDIEGILKQIENVERQIDYEQRLKKYMLKNMFPE